MAFHKLIYAYNQVFMKYVINFYIKIIMHIIHLRYILTGCFFMTLCV